MLLRSDMSGMSFLCRLRASVESLPKPGGSPLLARLQNWT
jgi:hypothetical protein